MLTNDAPVRIYDAETLKYLGTYDTKKVIITQPGDGHHVVVMSNVDKWFLITSFLILFAGVIAIAAGMNHTILRLKSEVAHYEEITGMNAQYISIETIAGRYATNKGSIPNDKDSIFRFICETGAWYPEVIMAQLQLESNYLKSDIGKNANNGFGMKKCGEGPNSRPNLQIAGMNYHGYGMYINWCHTILDRVLWDLWVIGDKPATMNDYLEMLRKKNYAEDPDYLKKVSKLAEQWRAQADIYRAAHDTLS